MDFIRLKYNKINKGSLKMNEKVKKRRDAIINVAFIAMVLGLVYIFFKYFQENIITQEIFKSSYSNVFSIKFYFMMIMIFL